MTIAKIKELRGRRDKAVKVMRDLVHASEEADRDMTADELVTYRNAEKEIDGLEPRIRRLERDLELVNAGSGPSTRGGRGDDDLGEGDGLDDDDELDLDPDSPAAKKKREQDARFQRVFQRAFGEMLRYGAVSHPVLNRELAKHRATIAEFGSGNRNQAALNRELRDLNVGTPASGGHTVPQGFWNQLVEAQKAYGGMIETCQVISTDSGNTLPVPTESDIANAATIVGEAVQSNTSVDATFGAINLGAYMYRTVVKVSLELLQDSAFNIDAYLSRKFGIRFGRGMNAHFTTGTGSGQPTGITASSGGAATGKTGTTSQTTTVIFNDLIDLEHSIDPLYRRQAKWMMHDLSLKVIKKLVDGQSRPIWMPDYGTNVAAASAQILGYPYVINQDMPQMAANAKSIAFGDWSYYMVRRAMGLLVLRLTERYADFGQVGFIGFARADGKYINVNDPIKLYVNSAT